MDLKTIRAELELRRATLVKRNAKIEARLRRDGEGLAADWPDQAQQRENDEVLEGLDSAGRAELVAIEAALDRVADGSYGRCLECAEPIADKRLAAVPTATLCIDCAE